MVRDPQSCGVGPRFAEPGGQQPPAATALTSVRRLGELPSLELRWGAGRAKEKPRTAWVPGRDTRRSSAVEGTPRIGKKLGVAGQILRLGAREPADTREGFVIRAHSWLLIWSCPNGQESEPIGLREVGASLGWVTGGVELGQCRGQPG